MCGGREYGDVGQIDWKIISLLHENAHNKEKQSPKLGEFCKVAEELAYFCVGIDPKRLTLVNGGAKGADFAGRWWAERFGMQVETYEADWDTHGRAAGPIRNQRMIDEGKPDLVLAFPGGRGTADMVRRAEKAGIEVRRVGWSG